MPPLSNEEKPWWYDLVATALLNPVFDNSRAIFTNRSLRFNKIKAVGFDFDHTLGLYNCDELDKLAMQLVIDRLVKNEQIPKAYFETIPDPIFAQKGLIIDVEEGNVLKIDRFGHVVCAYHGAEKLSQQSRRDIYSDVDCIPHVTQGRRFIQIDSAFAKPEVLLFSALVPHVGKTNGGYQSLWYTIRSFTDLIHKDGSLKNLIMRDPQSYVNPDFDIVRMLRKLRAAGKQVFLLTNSEWEYTDVMLNPALGISPDSADSVEIDLFDFIFCDAAKPDFFRNPSPQPAVAVAGHDNVFRGGHIGELEEKLCCGKRDVLFVGDHIYSDLITSKRSTYWRTMLVISELKEELDVLTGLPGMAQGIKQADERRLLTEHEVRHWTAIQAALSRCSEQEYGSLVASVKVECVKHRERAVNALREYIKQRETLHSKLSEAINPYWGSLFRARSELTYYAMQLENFACTYTSHASNLALYPDDHYFRSGMDYLPHEIQSM